jgi:hypothetical protein
MGLFFISFVPLLANSVFTLSIHSSDPKTKQAQGATSGGRL